MSLASKRPSTAEDIDPAGYRSLSTQLRVSGVLVARKVKTVALIIAIALLQSCATQKPDILQMVADAKTPADHEAIAAYYQNQAAEAQLQATFHRELADTYRRYHNTYKNMMLTHCEIMADDYEKIAAEDSALAQEHRRLAQPAK